jgi:hypothetical protein
MAAFWKRAIETSSPAMLRGAAGIALFIEATRWVPERLALHDYVIYGLLAALAVSVISTLYGIVTGH